MSHPAARIWKNRPDPSTPLSAENLIDMESRTLTWADDHLAGKVLPEPGSGQDGMGFVYDHVAGAMVWRDVRKVVPGGNLGASVTLDPDENFDVWLTGVLATAPGTTVTIDPTGLTPGALIVLDLTQPAAGDRTLAISDGTTTEALTIPTAPNTAFLVRVYSPDGVDLHVEVAGGGLEVTQAELVELETRALALESDRAVATKTANYTMTPADGTILADATAGAVTITLPTAATDGQRVTVRKVDSSANAVTVQRGGSDTIGLLDAATSLTLSLQDDYVELRADGTSRWDAV